MTSDTRKILTSMRLMAWERAQGNLQEMRQTFHSDSDPDFDKASKKQFEALSNAITEFVNLVDNKGLAD